MSDMGGHCPAVVGIGEVSTGGQCPVSGTALEERCEQIAESPEKSN